MGVLTNNWSLLMGDLATAPSSGANLRNVGVTTCNGTNTVDAEYANTYVNISSSVNKSLTYSGDASATDAKCAQIILGTGTTAPTVDDIKLESILSDDDIDCLEVVSITRTYARTGYGGGHSSSADTKYNNRHNYKGKRTRFYNSKFIGGQPHPTLSPRIFKHDHDRTRRDQAVLATYLLDSYREGVGVWAC